MERYALTVATDGTIGTVPYDGQSGTAYKVLQEAVQGSIEAVSFWVGATPLVMWVNEEGKLDGLPLNPTATCVAQHLAQFYDLIVGNVAFTINEMDEDGNDRGMTAIEARILTTLFQNLMRAEARA